MLETLIVAAIVVVAAGYAVWALMPAVTRQKLALRAAHSLGGPGAPGLSGKLAGVLQKVAKAPSGGCSECPAATLTPAERAERDRKQTPPL